MDRNHVTYLLIYMNVYMNDIEIVFGNFGRKCIMPEDSTANYHIGLKRRHIVRTGILPTYKTRNRICVTDVRKVRNGKVRTA